MEHRVYLRIAPDLRRIAWYAVVSGIAFAPVAYGVQRFAGADVVHSVTCMVIPLLLLALPGAVGLLLQWPLRIDEHGIARRVYFRWQQWNWDDFSSGRIAKRYPYGFYDPQRPWWDREFALPPMAEADIEQTMELINTRYVLPDPPRLPSELQLRRGFKSTKLDASGVCLTSGKRIANYSWSKIQRVHIIRTDPVRRDFQSLEIVLPDREVVFRVLRDSKPNWYGATAEEINQFLFHYVPAERIDVDIVGQRPAKRIDVEKRLDKLTKSHRDCRQGLFILALVLLATFVWMAITMHMAAMFAMAAILAYLPVPIVYFLEKQFREQRCELQSQLAAFDDKPESQKVPAT